jgi:hypothetical protein
MSTKETIEWVVAVLGLTVKKGYSVRRSGGWQQMLQSPVISRTGFIFPLMARLMTWEYRMKCLIIHTTPAPRNSLAL